MKKLWIIALSLIFIGNVAFSQNNDFQIKALKKKIEKIDQKLQTPKGANNYKLWAKKGKLLLDAYEINIDQVSLGMPAKMLPFIGEDQQEGTEPYYGKPKKIITQDGKDYWIYDKVTFIVQNGRIVGWKITKPVVEDALKKSYEAYKKAISLDQKGKFIHRNSTKRQLAKLRDYLRTKSIEFYQDGKYDKALDYMEMAMDLYHYPRMKDDTVNMKPGQLEYYAGVFAYNAGKYDKAVEYFKKAIAKNYEVGTSYQLMTQALKKLGREQEAVKLLEEGAKKYPTESKIIFALIDYYKPHGQLDKAFYYLDKAIKLKPNMAILYLVKGDAYNQLFNEYSKKYYKLLDETDSLKKAAFRARFKKAEHDRLMAEHDSLMKIQDSIEQEMNKYFDLAVEWFKKGISKDTTNADGYYTLGALYYNRAMAVFLRAQKIPTSDTQDYNKLMKQYENYLNLAREQFEKAYKLTPNDIQTMQNLSIIYYKLRMYDKHKEMKQKIYELRQKQQQQQNQQQQKSN